MRLKWTIWWFYSRAQFAHRLLQLPGMVKLQRVARPHAKYRNYPFITHRVSEDRVSLVSLRCSVGVLNKHILGGSNSLAKLGSGLQWPSPPAHHTNHHSPSLGPAQMHLIQGSRHCWSHIIGYCTAIEVNHQTTQLKHTWDTREVLIKWEEQQQTAKQPWTKVQSGNKP